MKKFYCFLFLLHYCFGQFSNAFAQAPQGINYQAVARDASGKPIASQTIAVGFNIRCGAPSGNNISYTETPNLSTNPFGLFTWVIGSSSAHPGFDTIAWGKHKYFLEVTVNGSSMGSTQFVAVPYAFHAHTADSIINLPVSLSSWTKSGGNIFPTVSTDNVGIGTNSPGVKLEVAGHVKITDGTEGLNKILTSDANGNASWQNPPGGGPNGGFSNMQVFPTAGLPTFTVSTGVTKVMIEVWGAGGGGAGSGGSNPAGGGGGGGYAKGIFNVTPLSVLTITVGAAGTGGQASGSSTGNGGSGGTSSVTSILSSVNISATGGAGGNIAGAGGAGGSSTAPFNITGGSGFYGGTNYISYGGGGANGGSGGSGGANSAGGAGIAPGGGGGGGYANITATGGAGAPGRVVIWW